MCTTTLRLPAQTNALTHQEAGVGIKERGERHKLPPPPVLGRLGVAVLHHSMASMQSAMLGHVPGTAGPCSKGGLRVHAPNSLAGTPLANGLPSQSHPPSPLCAVHAPPRPRPSNPTPTPHTPTPPLPALPHCPARPHLRLLAHALLGLRLLVDHRQAVADKAGPVGGGRARVAHLQEHAQVGGRLRLACRAAGGQSAAQRDASRPAIWRVVSPTRRANAMPHLRLCLAHGPCPCCLPALLAGGFRDGGWMSQGNVRQSATQSAAPSWTVAGAERAREIKAAQRGQGLEGPTRPPPGSVGAQPPLASSPLSPHRPLPAGLTPRSRPPPQPLLLYTPPARQTIHPAR